MAKRDNEKAAKILAEAALLRNDAKVCERWGITTRTLQNYRAALAEDGELSASFINLLKATETQDWLTQLDATMQSVLKKIADGLELFAPESFSDLVSLAGIIDTLSEIRLSRDMYGIDEPNKGTETQGAGTESRTRRQGEGAAPSGLN